jgi:hypothetical protein
VSAAAVEVSSAFTVFEIALPYLVLVAVLCEPLLLLIMSEGVNIIFSGGGVGLARGAFLGDVLPIASVMTFLSAPIARGFASEAAVSRIKFSCVWDCE